MNECEIVQDWVREIVQQSSGGIKFVELVTKLLVKTKECSENWGTIAKRVSNPEWVEQAIEEMDDIEILRYSWQLSGEMSREKLFIYTP